MNQIFSTNKFDQWMHRLTDLKARSKIGFRIERARLGNFSDSKSVGGGIFEMRVDHGPGYRIYYARQGKTTYLLVCGGDKSTQAADITMAKAIWQRLTTTPH